MLNRNSLTWIRLSIMTKNVEP